jgi:gamma-glutamylcyclotransferase (GGCT)/AIG2-like uncharacterized protein YtfP
MGSVYLFVYGSLKRGGLHHDELAGCGGSRCLGVAQTLPGYGLVRAGDGDYLALVADGSDGVVSGELFEVPDSLLARLDEFEGADYERAEVALATGQGQAALATGQGQAALATVRGQAALAPQSAHLPFALAYFGKAR